ncbi:MAG: hypothetical protein GXP51_01120 [Deltaproteobacteria bacterium]|nr:hypothetical protein [Deltaproteobacteria bacterium]
MSDVNFADIFLIILICALIWAILSLTSRSKKKTSAATKETPVNPAEKNPPKTTEDD